MQNFYLDAVDLNAEPIKGFKLLCDNRSEIFSQVCISGMYDNFHEAPAQIPEIAMKLSCYSKPRDMFCLYFLEW